ncbi:MAG TPA: apolipoprotein N-acyltransferase [Desulfotignum sp.]|nr:apolipoprotein N-acyltransferase [Desulfotignum sp.]
MRALNPYFPALVSGLFLTLSFPDVNLYYLGFVALAPLIISLDSMTVRQAFAAGFAAGFVHFSTLLYWIVPTLCTYGELHWILSVSALTLLCLYLSLYPALFAFALRKLAPPPVLFPLAGAAIWTALEWIRTHLFTGFPWGVLGYSQHSNRLFIQMADITGVLGISFILVLCGTLTAMAWRLTTAGRDSRPPGTPVVICLGYTLVSLAGAYAYGMHQIGAMARETARAPQIRIAIVQGNIRQDLKWSMAFRQATIEKYGSLSLAAARSKPDLIIWPETALPFYYGHDPLLSSQVDQYVRQAETYFLVGSPAVDTTRDPVRYFNRVFLLNPLSIQTGFYDKTHLVPFGEYVPFQDLLFFIEKLTAEAGNFSRGDPAFIPLAFKDHQTGVLICFEILFPDIARQFVNNRADLLTAVTNDAWFGHTSAAAQHFSIAVLRAVENRRSVARAANTGISGFIDPAGEVFQTTALFTDAVIVHPLPALTRVSFYTRHGDILAVICVIALGMGFVVKSLPYFKRRLHP